MYPSFKRIFFLFITISFLAISCSSDDTTEKQKSSDNLIDNDETVATNELKAKAIELYKNYYLASEMEPSEMAWIDGDVINCIAGKIPETTKNKILQRLLYFRKATGLDNTITVNPTKSAKAQEAALMTKANNALDHFPPNSWKCYSEDGSTAASKSNLAIFSGSAVNAIDLYINDFGNSNFGVGHRRWILWPKLQDIGIGSTDRTNTLWVVGDSGPRPPNGYIPSQLAYNRWSFSLRQANFENTAITLTYSEGKNIPLSIEDIKNGIGDNTIVWVPEGINKTSKNDESYTVTLENVIVSGESKNFEYKVILFDTNGI